MRAVFLMMLVVPVFLFGQGQDGGIGRGMGRGSMRPRMNEPLPEPISLTQMMLVQYLNLHRIQREYLQKVREISDQTRLQSEYLRQQLAAHEKRFFELASRDPLAFQNQEEMLDILEEMNRINRQLFALQKQAMKQIENLNTQREKELMGGMESWVKRARKNPNELIDFVKFVEKTGVKTPLKPATEIE